MVKPNFPIKNRTYLPAFFDGIQNFHSNVPSHVCFLSFSRPLNCLCSPIFFVLKNLRLSANEKDSQNKRKGKEKEKKMWTDATRVKTEYYMRSIVRVAKSSKKKQKRAKNRAPLLPFECQNSRGSCLPAFSEQTEPPKKPEESSVLPKSYSINNVIIRIIIVSIPFNSVNPRVKRFEKMVVCQ